MTLRPFLATVVIAGVASACVPPSLDPEPQPIVLQGSAVADEYAPYMKPGSSAINGQSFLTTRGGDVKLGAGRVVTLDPATTYAAEWFKRTGGEIRMFDLIPPDSLFAQARRTTVVDAQGKFRFANLPAGQYIVRSTVTWENGVSTQGGVVAEIVTLAAAEQQDLILNRLAARETGMAAGRAKLLTKEEIGDRKFRIAKAVVGRSCKRGVADPAPTEAAARDDLARAGAKESADGIINVVCSPGGMTLRYNCTSFIECTGDAIRWLS